KCLFFRAFREARYVDIVGVAGSIPAAPTILKVLQRLAFFTARSFPTTPHEPNWKHSGSNERSFALRCGRPGISAGAQLMRPISDNDASPAFKPARFTLAARANRRHARVAPGQ